jgi:ubiquinone/menaquinone biosynthesis C-methylase UbiE
MPERLTYTDDYESRVHRARYEFAAKVISGGVVLDVATGTGCGGMHLLALNPQITELVAVDRNRHDLWRKCTDSAVHKVHFVAANASQLPFPDNCFDYVVSFETIEHLPDEKPFLRAIHKTLKRSGKLIISTPNWGVESLAKTPNLYHINHFSQRRLTETLERHFQNLESFGQRPYTWYEKPPAFPGKGLLLRLLERSGAYNRDVKVRKGLAEPINLIAVGTKM